MIGKAAHIILKDKLQEKSEEARAQENLIKEKNKEAEKKKLDTKKKVVGEDELSITLERLYKTSDQMTKQQLELNELTEATKIFTIIMGKTNNKAIQQMRKGDIFVNNNAANLVEFGKYANSNFISYKINAELNNGRELSKNFNIRGFPTILFLNVLFIEES